MWTGRVHTTPFAPWCPITFIQFCWVVKETAIITHRPSALTTQNPIDLLHSSPTQTSQKNQMQS